MKKSIRYILGIVAVLLLVYFSLDIENLQEHQAKSSSLAFNPTDYAARFWDEELPQAIDNAPDVVALFRNLEEDPELAFKEYGKKLGISHTSYFLMKGKGIIDAVDEEYLVVSVNERITLRIATEFIFGNAVRDDSGRVDINDFMNMTDFNNVSIAINNLVKERIVSRLKNVAVPGKQIDFAGAAELNEDQFRLDSLRIIPVKAIVSDGS